MKKLIYVGCFAVLLVAAGACKKENKNEGDKGKIGEVEWNVKDGTLTFSGKGAIPDNWEKNWSNESWRNSLKTVVIEEGITSIGNWAFYKCYFSSVVIPNSVTSIGGNAFCSCGNLISLIIPNSVTSIGDCAFFECGSLTSITISNSVTSIGQQTFCKCSSLTSATIPNSVTSIGDMAFNGCSNLSSVTFGSSVTSIEKWAFAGCENLTTITNLNPIPVAIDYDVFYGINQSACTLKVPASSVSAYQNAEVWKEFNIVGI